MVVRYFFLFKQKTAYKLRISDWSSDVCSSDLFGSDRKSSILICSRRLAVAANDQTEDRNIEIDITHGVKRVGAARIEQVLRIRIAGRRDRVHAVLVGTFFDQFDTVRNSVS